MKRSEVGFNLMEMAPEVIKGMEVQYTNSSTESIEMYNRYYRDLHTAKFSMGITTQGATYEEMEKLYNELGDYLASAFAKVNVTKEVIMRNFGEGGIAFFDEDDKIAASMDRFLDDEDSVKMYINVRLPEDLSKNIKDFLRKDYSNLCDFVYQIARNYKVGTTYWST